MRYILRVFFAISITFSITIPLSDILNYDLSVTTLLVMLLAAHLLLNILLYDLKVLKWFFIILGSSIFVIMMLMLIFNGRITAPGFMSEYFSSLFDAAVNMEYISDDIVLPTMALIIFGISVPVYIMSVKTTSYISIFVIVFTYFGVLSIAGLNVDFIYVLLFVLTALLMYLEKYFSSRFSDERINKVLLRTLPSMLIFATLITGLSAATSSLSTDPVGFVDSIVDDIRALRLFRKGSGSQGTVSYQTETGFSESSSFQSSTLVLTVDSPSTFKLRSQVYDSYDGRNWNRSRALRASESAIAQGSDFFPVDLFENILSYYNLKNDLRPGPVGLDEFPKGIIEEILPELFDSTSINITYENIRTKAIFAPAGTYNFSTADQDDIIFDNISGALSFDSTAGKNTSYVIRVLSPKNFSSELAPLLQEIDSSKSPDTAFVRDDLDIFMQIPDSIPDRVRDLTFEITDAQDNDYDKARAIERYLSLNYEYSTDVESTPGKFDFIDHFLFEQQTGYCTYYASSMVMMARIAGIPARYARGFVMPEKTPIDTTIDDLTDFIGLDELVNDTIYRIYEMHSHAWPELYIKGYGWMAFEPTAAYYFSYLPDDSADDISFPDQDEITLPDGEDSTNEINLGPVIRIFLLILLISFIAFPFIYRNLKKLRYRSYDVRRKIIFTFKKIIDVLKLIDKDIYAHETAKSYAKRIDGEIYLGNKKLSKIADIFDKARYSKNELTILDLITVEKFYHSSKKEIMSQASRFKIAGFYLIYKL